MTRETLAQLQRYIVWHRSPVPLTAFVDVSDLCAARCFSLKLGNETAPDTSCMVPPFFCRRDQLMQATVNLRVLDANTFLRDSLIGSYQFDLLGIYVEKVL